MCDKRFLAGKQEFLIAKQKAAEAKQCKAAEAAEAKIPVKLTASEKRDLIVEVASKVWFDDIREADIVSAGLRSGLAVAADGSEDCKVDVVCPRSGKRLFPSRDGVPTCHTHQQGQGLVVAWHGNETVVQKPLAESPVGGARGDRS